MNDVVTVAISAMMFSLDAGTCVVYISFKCYGPKVLRALFELL